MSDRQTNLFYEFGPFRVDVAERLLLRDGIAVPLPPKAFDTLLVLIEKSGRLVEKGELMKRLWPDTFVEEANLAHNISLLRKTFDEGSNGNKYIQTVPRHGYRWLVEVKEFRGDETPPVLRSQDGHPSEQPGQELEVQSTAEPEGVAAGRITATPAISSRSGVRSLRVMASLILSIAPGSARAKGLTLAIKRHKRGIALVLTILMVAIAAISYLTRTGQPIDSVAILPFVNANADPNIEYLSDGIPESIINSLSQLPNIKVMSRNSVFRFKGREVDAQEVGQKLGVRAVLTGRVAQRSDALAISIELVDARDNSQLWGQQYNRRLADVFALQEEMAKEISERLRLKLSGAERQQLARRPTENLKAFQYYMQGRSYMQRRTYEDQLTAIRYCERALAEDNNYALAYAGLADAYGTLGIYGYIAPIEGRRKEEETARKALAIDENLAEGHLALGHTQTSFSPSNFLLGERELQRAIELSPSEALAHFYLGVSFVRQGRMDEGLAEYLKARELDPLASNIARNVAAPYYLKRDYGRALELLREANELGPAFSTTWETGVYIQNRLFNETLAELEQAKRERKNDSILTSSTGMLYAARGDRAEALEIIKELEALSGASLSQAHWIAKIYAILNEKELALTWLDHGLAAGAIGPFLKDEPVWDTIRSDPRFTDLLRRIGLPQN